jgi:uncharacterized protein YdiU (UPF0061 family)
LLLSHNPLRIPRNQAVETALHDAEEGRYEALHRLLKAVERPYEQDLNATDLETAPLDSGIPYRTFCGT